MVKFIRKNRAYFTTVFITFILLIFVFSFYYIAATNFNFSFPVLNTTYVRMFIGEISPYINQFLDFFSRLLKDTWILIFDGVEWLINIII